MTKALVTGAAGFMGSHLFDHLISKGMDVKGIDNYSIGTYEHKNILKGDLLDKGYVNYVVNGFRPEIVYHLAAWAHEGLSQFSPIQITENNYNAFLNLIVACINNGVKRVVVTSSMSVYGDQIPPFTEDMPRKPVDIYGVSKTAMEETLEILSKVHGFQYVIIRPHNVYGPRQSLHDPYRNVVGIFINRMLANKSFFIYGDGEQKRSFSYIDDVTRYLAMAGWEDVDGQIFNIGPTEEYTINRLADEVMKHFSDAPKPTHEADRPLEVREAWSDNKKAIELLGYETTTSFEDGIKKMVEWAKTVGHQPTRYLDNLEIINSSTPKTWTERKI